MPTIVYFLIGVFIGSIITSVLSAPKTVGNFLIDKSDSQKDIYRLDFEVPMDDIPNHKLITLRVRNDSKLSQ